MTRLWWAWRAIAMVVILGGAIALWRVSQPAPEPDDCGREIAVEIAADGSLVVDGDETDMAGLEGRLAGLSRDSDETRGTVCVVIAAPENAPFGPSYEVGEIARDTGFRVRYAESD